MNNVWSLFSESSDFAIRKKAVIYQTKSCRKVKKGQEKAEKRDWHLRKGFFFCNRSGVVEKRIVKGEK